MLFRVRHSVRAMLVIVSRFAGIETRCLLYFRYFKLLVIPETLKQKFVQLIDTVFVVVLGHVLNNILTLI